MAGRYRRQSVSKTGNNFQLVTEIPPFILDAVRRWFSIWGLRGFEKSVTICFSCRMSRVFGRCYVKERLITIAERLREMPLAILEEVLCHECAHLAASQLFGGNCRPHGPEWAQLVRSAGFEPRRRLVLDKNAISTPNRQRSYVYVHSCPVCQTQRVARRMVRTWRCAGCRSSGLNGLLEIQRYQFQKEIDP
jgi:predicted SprT family Zn-dependent metalloprotease